MTAARSHNRLACALSGAALLGAAPTACSVGGDTPATYTPAAYWQSVDNIRECFYVDDTQEAYSLMDAGLCPAGSMPTQMPADREAEYWSYYSSPAYYNTYVPVSYRTRYTRVTVASFSRAHSTQITSLSSKAVYTSSKGGTAAGSKVNAAQFGGGSRSSQSYGGGSRNGGAAAKNSNSVPRSAGRK